MTSFCCFQSFFTQYVSDIFGLNTDNGQEIHWGEGLCPNNDNGLWKLLDTTPSGASFFEIYSAVVTSLTSGSGHLDIIQAAKDTLSQWGDKPPAWEKGYAAMLRKLQKTSSLTMAVKTPASTVLPYWGLWREDDRSARLSNAFASGNTTIKVDYNRFLTFSPNPEYWCVTEALSQAYKNPKGLPWTPGSQITWDSTFGPGGPLTEMTIGLFIAMGVKFTCSSSTCFDVDDQAYIKEKSKTGLWPHYTPTFGRVDFDRNGHLTITIQIEKDSPFIIGTATQDIKHYFGL